MPAAPFFGGNGLLIKPLNKMKQLQFSFKSRASSFGFAFEGLFSFFRNETNAWIHLASTVIVAALAVYCKLSPNEIICLVIVTGLVWVAELFNTAIERIMDFVSGERHPGIKIIKDLAAGAVLLSAVTAFVTGVIIFIPKLF
jgi:diacylglycerol kinase